MSFEQRIIDALHGLEGLAEQDVEQVKAALLAEEQKLHQDVIDTLQSKFPEVLAEAQAFSKELAPAIAAGLQSVLKIVASALGVALPAAAEEARTPIGLELGPAPSTDPPATTG